jgi:lysophospholipase L1-like esterase
MLSLPAACRRALRPLPAAAAALAVTALPLSAQTPAPQPTPPLPQAVRWEQAIARFEAQDRVTPPPQGAVLFVGSSSIVRWKTLAQDFPGMTTLNRGFGGSVIADTTRYVRRIVVPYHPRKIVIFAGDNDIAGGRSPEAVVADFAGFVTTVRASLPDIPVIFIGIKPSPSRWNLHEKQEKANRLVAEYCGRSAGLTFVDVYRPMLGSDGRPRPELFAADRLHMSPAGYAIWTPLVAPHLN